MIWFTYLYCVALVFYFFFFSSRRRHTRLTCDWSSDVCSSDLDDLLRRVPADPPGGGRGGAARRRERVRPVPPDQGADDPGRGVGRRAVVRHRRAPGLQIGRASCRERVWMSVVVGGLHEKERSG